LERLALERKRVLQLERILTIKRRQKTKREAVNFTSYHVLPKRQSQSTKNRASKKTKLPFKGASELQENSNKPDTRKKN